MQATEDWLDENQLGHHDEFVAMQEELEGAANPFLVKLQGVADVTAYIRKEPKIVVDIVAGVLCHLEDYEDVDNDDNYNFSVESRVVVLIEREITRRMRLRRGTYAMTSWVKEELEKRAEGIEARLAKSVPVVVQQALLPLVDQVGVLAGQFASLDTLCRTLSSASTRSAQIHEPASALSQQQHHRRRGDPRTSTQPK